MNFGFHQVTAADYHADKLHERPALSSSVAAILLRESARKAWHAHPRLNPAFVVEHEDKFDLGTAAHAMLLEPPEKNIVIVAADDWRTKAAKEARDAARTAGKTAILERQAKLVRNMVDTAIEFLLQSEVASDWENAESEVTGLAEDNGVIVKARFDRITLDRRVIIDYKTTTDVSPDGFGRQLVRMGYHWQDAFYRRVARLLGSPEPEFVFLAQSVDAPYECTLHACHPGLKEIADFDVARAIAEWGKCLTNESWPSYGGRIHWALPTTWQMSDHEQRLQEAA